MHKEGFNGIFKNAITKLKECHLTSRRFNNKVDNILDDEIDFDNEKLGESREVPHSKMRSAIIQNEKKTTPYQMKDDNQFRKINISKKIEKPLKMNTKIIGEKKIILKRGLSSSAKNFIPVNNNLFNKSDTFTWKHDLFSDIPNINYKVFIRNLACSVSQDDLHEIFSQYGIISGINIERDTAEVFFVRKDSAIRAAENANGLEIQGKRIKSTFYDEDVKCNNQNNTKKDIVIQINTTKKEPIWNRIKLANNN